MDKQTHILIVEDSEDDGNMFAQFLAMKGYRVSQASDGMEAVEKAIDLQPHLILMDLLLPKMNGLDAMHRIKADKRTTQIPVVMITGYFVVQPRSFNCDGWLVKPCPLDQLDAEITRVLLARP